jgi:hypothetical protein
MFCWLLSERGAIARVAVASRAEFAVYSAMARIILFFVLCLKTAAFSDRKYLFIVFC